MKNLLVCILFLGTNYVLSQKEEEKIYLKPASEIIDTANFLYYPIKGDFEVHINKEEYFFTIESNLMFDPNCYYDYQYWVLIQNPTENNLEKIIPTPFKYKLESFIYYELIEKHAVIWDRILLSYRPCFFIGNYDDVGSSGKEIYVVRTNKVYSDSFLVEVLQEKWRVAKKALRIY